MGALSVRSQHPKGICLGVFEVVAMATTNAVPTGHFEIFY